MNKGDKPTGFLANNQWANAAKGANDPRKDNPNVQKILDNNKPKMEKILKDNLVKSTLEKYQTHYKKKANDLNRRLQLLVLYGKNKLFCMEYDPSISAKQINDLLQKKKGALTKNSLEKLEKSMEHYHFYMTDLVMKHLVIDQQKDKDPKFQTIVQISMPLHLEKHEMKPDYDRPNMTYAEFNRSKSIFN